MAAKASPGQLALPVLDMRAICPLCGKPALFLGQYSPLWPWGVCRNCSQAEPYPIEVFEIDPRSKDRSGLKIAAFVLLGVAAGAIAALVPGPVRDAMERWRNR